MWELVKQIPIIEEDGILLEEYPVDESQTVPNAGDASVYSWAECRYEIITWRSNAEEHRDGDKSISKLTEEV